MMTQNEPTGETMAEGSDLPPLPDVTETPDSASLLDSVPLDLLSQPDDHETMTAPAVGDKVAYSKEGTVTAINGGTAVISVTHVNGQELPKATEPEAGEGPDTMEGLESQANEMDQQGAY